MVAYTHGTLTTIFDADNHYWETSDAFTRHRASKFAERGVRLVDIDGSGTPRYVLAGGRLHPILPGPGDVFARPRPGSLYDYFAGKSDKGRLGSELSSEDPSAHPEWFDRDARVACMDDQGVEAAWLFPSHAVCMEGPIQPDIEAAVHILGAFNRWLEEDWGFAYKDRIFGVPYLTLSDLEEAVAQLEWCLDCGARVVSIRNGPVFTPEGTKSPADPTFDPFWARVAEAGVVVAPHAGFEDGYVSVTRAVAEEWGRSETSKGTGDAVDQYASVINMLMKHRLVRDFAAILVADKLFERNPGVRIAFIENGGTWVGDLLHGLQMIHGQNPGMFTKNPVDQFVEHCWVAPFVEDSVPSLAEHLPVERILFGSDWPHAEGLGSPRDFFKNVEEFSIEDQDKIMWANARHLTLAMPTN
jgi:predicted TIM-barrel fold metal-dependent hydrolase